MSSSRNVASRLRQHLLLDQQQQQLLDHPNLLDQPQSQQQQQNVTLSPLSTQRLFDPSATSKGLADYLSPRDVSNVSGEMNNVKSNNASSSNMHNTTAWGAASSAVTSSAFGSLPMLPEFSDLLSPDSINMSINNAIITENRPVSLNWMDLQQPDSALSVHDSLHGVGSTTTGHQIHQPSEWDFSQHGSTAYNVQTIPQASPNRRPSLADDMFLLTGNDTVSINNDLNSQIHQHQDVQSFSMSTGSNFGTIDRQQHSPGGATSRFSTTRTALPPGFVGLGHVDDHSSLDRPVNSLGRLDATYSTFTQGESGPLANSVRVNSLSANAINNMLPGRGRDPFSGILQSVGKEPDLQRLQENAEMLRSLGFIADTIGGNSQSSSSITFLNPTLDPATAENTVVHKPMRRKVTRVRSKKSVANATASNEHRDDIMANSHNNINLGYPAVKRPLADLETSETMEPTQMNYDKSRWLSSTKLEPQTKSTTQLSRLTIEKNEEKPKKRSKVSKACVPCRTAHVSCDHARPCSRCVRKGCEAACRDTQSKADILAALSRSLRTNMLEIMPKVYPSSGEPSGSSRGSHVGSPMDVSPHIRGGGEDGSDEIHAAAKDLITFGRYPPDGDDVLSTHKTPTTTVPTTPATTPPPPQLTGGVRTRASSTTSTGIDLLRDLSPEDLARLSKLIGDTVVGSGIFGKALTVSNGGDADGGGDNVTAAASAVAAAATEIVAQLGFETDDMQSHDTSHQ